MYLEHGMCMPVLHALCGSAGASFLGTLAELFSKKVDDNLTIPLFAALGLWCILQVM